jgi:NhaA family Na+:H+ antiporter
MTRLWRFSFCSSVWNSNASFITANSRTSKTRCSRFSRLWAGLAFPALIHFALNNGTASQAGIGIPMATDIAFTLGVLAIMGNRVPASLKVFVVAFAVLDDLCAILIIAVFYTAQLSVSYLVGAVTVWLMLYAVSRFFKIKSLVFFLLGGVLLWFLMYQSGVHATIAGVLLAFALPSSEKEDDEESPSYQLEHLLHKPVAFVILPISKV